MMAEENVAKCVVAWRLATDVASGRRVWPNKNNCLAVGCQGWRWAVPGNRDIWFACPSRYLIHSIWSSCGFCGV